ncbi:penicillin-binding protein 1A [soil metagenome]
MRDPFQSNRKRKRRLRLIEVDAWIDSSLFKLGRLVALWAEAFSLFMRRFRVTGFTRAVVEVASDAVTLGAGGAVVMLALALPAFEATKSDWRSKGDLAITFLDRFGNEIGKRGIRQSDAVPLEQMPDHLIKAVIATEDRRFFDHFGIDVLGTGRALVENLRANAVVQGGSSLSQQLAKNLFLSNERTIERKIKEAFLALWLEANLSKDEILKLYLDRAYMGGGAFGVEAASEFYYNKSVKDVSLAEAALLAGLFKAPARYAPHVNLPAARARANEVLTNMVQSGFMTEGQVIGARRHPADVVEHAAASGSPDYFLDWAFNQVKNLDLQGDRVLTVKTTVDLGMQHAAETAVEDNLRQYGKTFNIKQGAAVLVEPDGAVRAMVGGRDYGDSQFNRATDALRQPGSSFKVFTYATAMANGFTPKSIVQDAPICIGDWCPKNYSGGFSGPIPITTALVKSINVIPVRLAQAVGRDKIVATARKMGITSELRITRSLPLGSSEVTVIDMAGAYAVFANGGYKATPYAFTQIHSGLGELLFDRKRDVPPPERALDPKVVADMNSMLVQVPEWGTGVRAKLDGIRTAGKTGTTSAYHDAWFVGFTGNFAAAVWFGNDGYEPTRRLTGGIVPAQTWKQFMTFAHKGVEVKPIPFIENPIEKPSEAPPVVAAGDAPPVADTPKPITLADEATARLVTIEGLMKRAAGLKPTAALSTPPTTGPAVVTPVSAAPPAVKPAPVAR